MSESIRARETGHGADRCAFCHEAFAEAGGDEASERVACVGCGTPHHAECFAENGACSAFGCEHGVARVPTGVSLAAADLGAGWRERARPLSAAIPLLCVGFGLLILALASEKFPLLGPVFIALGIGVSLLDGMKEPEADSPMERLYAPPFTVAPSHSPANGYEGALLLNASSRRRRGERLPEPAGADGACPTCGRHLEGAAELSFCYHCGAVSSDAESASDLGGSQAS